MIIEPVTDIYNDLIRGLITLFVPPTSTIIFIYFYKHKT